MRRVTNTILHNVRVLAIDGQIGKPRSGTEAEAAETPDVFSNDTLATLELDAAQAELIINARADGELTLVLRSISDLTEDQSPEQRAANEAIRATSPFWK
jgi:pilus assembly protein CpaB